MNPCMNELHSLVTIIYFWSVPLPTHLRLAQGCPSRWDMANPSLACGRRTFVVALANSFCPSNISPSPKQAAVSFKCLVMPRAASHAIISFSAALAKPTRSRAVSQQIGGGARRQDNNIQNIRFYLWREARADSFRLQPQRQSSADRCSALAWRFDAPRLYHVIHGAPTPTTARVSPPQMLPQGPGPGFDRSGTAGLCLR